MKKQVFTHFEKIKDGMEGIFIEDAVFVEMMHNLNKNKDLVIEMDLLKDYNDELLSSLDNPRALNTIINYDNIRDFSKDNDIEKIFEFLTCNGICAVIEPNNNIYLDIDYTLLKKATGGSVSTDAIYSLMLHEKVQNFTVVNSNGKLLESAYDFKKQILIDCDFQKNSIIFPYCCEALNSIALSIDVYKN